MFKNKKTEASDQILIELLKAKALDMGICLKQDPRLKDWYRAALEVDGKPLLLSVHVKRNIVYMDLQFPFRCVTAATFLVAHLVTGFNSSKPMTVPMLYFNQNTGKLSVAGAIRVGKNPDMNLVAETIEDAISFAVAVYERLSDMCRGKINWKDKGFYRTCLKQGLEMLDGDIKENTCGLNAIILEEVEESAELFESEEE